MRLIHTKSLKLGEYHENEVSTLKYAILSHRWEDREEVSFQEMLEPTNQTKRKKGYEKIERFCRIAKDDGMDYAWVDTCCINKESSSELSEAINSMFRWYCDAKRCYAFLADVYTSDNFIRSVWFTRGWTLQELAAPKDMVFYNADWLVIDTRPNLASRISQRTTIDKELLLGNKSLESFCVSKRMSWAAGRLTERAEDRAYSLMGIFNVNIPLLYGEGDNAFIRLQEEIMKDSDDETIFAWNGDGVSESNPCGLLAPSPDCFADSGDILPHALSEGGNPFALTNRGIRMESPLVPPMSSITTLILQCVANSALIGIGIKISARNVYEDFDKYNSLKKPKPRPESMHTLCRITSNVLRGISPVFLYNSSLEMIYVAKRSVADPMKDPGFLTSGEDVLHRKIKLPGHFKKIIMLFDDIRGTYGLIADRHGDASNLKALEHILNQPKSSQVTYNQVWEEKTSVERFVITAYEFLLKNYNSGDEINFFGFGRGCHVVSKLSEMLDCTGIPESEDDIGSLDILGPSKRSGRRETGNVRFIGLFDAVQVVCNICLRCPL